LLERLGPAQPTSNVESRLMGRPSAALPPRVSTRVAVL